MYKSDRFVYRALRDAETSLCTQPSQLPGIAASIFETGYTVILPSHVDAADTRPNRPGFVTCL